MASKSVYVGEWGNHWVMYEKDVWQPANRKSN